ncbi:N-acetyltransferase [Cryobacterium sp. Hz7]|uniref:GNAT family N-acetyltransferase n=1 Tax=Cryobacterium sp. Hz7 TaxID=1259166 RepID=UPI00106B215B|nr:GNAT family N-acetyltransferase [Cryobacterium sp. Hz7]TFB67185.1 N-acetyltransferase [Cryobacterium sp. Hz7]
MDWPQPELVCSERLLLEPLAVDHAASMVDVLADPSLYEYTGGEAPSLDLLHSRYAAQSVGQADDGSQWWLNWIVTYRDTGEPAGFVQATVECDGSMLVAEIAWVISPRRQGQGIASEATQMMIGWLRAHEVNRFTAHIHPEHQASIGVARNQALRPTSTAKDGETRWMS